MTISNKEELQFLLHRGWEIEKKFESFAAWEGFVSVNSTHRMTVLTLARDSHKHRLQLEKLLNTLGLEAPTNEIPERAFDFTGMLDAEVLHRVIEQDEIARDLYTRILESTDQKLVSALSGGKDVEFFYETLKQMVKDEARHISMVKKITGDITRII